MSTVAVVLPAHVLLLDVAKRWFYRREATTPTRQASQSSRERRIARRRAVERSDLHPRSSWSTREV